jgi:RNA polymerase sigma factor (sigma-70 family)
MIEMNYTEEWVPGFRRGEAQSVRDLFSTHFSSLLIFAERIIRDKPEAREIVTETFIKLLNRRTFFDDSADIKAFLYITTRNLCMDFLRYARNGRPYAEAPLDIREADMNFSGNMEMDEAGRICLTALENLPPICQQVFKTLFVEGMATGIAARHLDLDPREMLIYRKKCLHQMQAALLDNHLYSTPFFVHFLAVACRANTAAQQEPVPVNR